MLERSAIIWGGCWLNVEWSVSSHNTKVEGFRDNEKANRYCYADRAGRHGIECSAYAQFPILEVWISVDDGQRQSGLDYGEDEFRHDRVSVLIMCSLGAL